MKKVQFKYFLILSFVALFASCSQEEMPADESDCLSDDFLEKLSFYTAEYQYVEDVIRVPGRITYNTNKVVRYVPLVSGLVTNMYYSLGDYVKKGQVLAEVRSSELLEISNSLKLKKSKLEILKQNYEIVKRQFNDGFASSREKLTAKNELQMLQNQIKKYKSKLELFGGDFETGLFRLRAPGDGYIVENNMSVGMQIYPESEPLFTVSDLDEVWIIANIYSELISKVEKGMAADITTTAYRDTVFKGKIDHMSNVFDKDSRVLQARISLPNNKVLLKPGMFVDILINCGTGKDKAIAVPNDAIIFENNKKHVVVYNDKCNIEIREIEELTKIKQKTFVASGIKENEKLVVQNALYLFHEFSK